MKFRVAAAYPDIRMAKYAGVGTLEQHVGATGNAATADSGGATTTVGHELWRRQREPTRRRVNFSTGASFPDLRILEFSGVSTLDQKVSVTAVWGTISSGSVTTMAANELLFGVDTTGGQNQTVGAGYTAFPSATGDADGNVVTYKVVTGDGDGNVFRDRDPDLQHRRLDHATRDIPLVAP